VQGDAERLLFSDGALGAVISVGTLHHLPHPERAVAEATRVLGDGGWMIARETNATPYRSALDFYDVLIPSWARSKMEWWRDKRRKRSEAENDEFHVGIRTCAQYREFFARVGMQVRVSTQTLPLFPFSLLGLHRHDVTWRVVAWVSDVLALAFPSLRDKGWAQIIDAQKGAADAIRG